ncbi:MAG: GTPase [Methanolobus sp.]|nr:GTPase [Methanolobus sp.]
MNEIKFKVAEKKTTQLFEKIKHLLGEIQNDEIVFIVDEFKNKLSDLQKKIKLEIAFVGQYSAGKSTIISAISGNKGIKIGQDITTDIPQAYPWGNLLLVDTPGIYAGRPEHDKVSIEYMNKADLLIYVITSQGFTSETAENFRKLAFVENRIDKIMLVINKSSQGDKEAYLKNWISDALKVTEPKTADDLFLCVIDAKDYLEALEIEDQEDSTELIKYSGYNHFLENLNAFISHKGILGRLITPLNLIQDYLNRIINQLTAGNEDTKNLLELLNRKHFRLIESKKNISNVVNGHIDTVVANVKKEGNKIANLIEKDGDKKTLESESKNSIENLKTLTDDINKKIEHSIESEFSQLQVELDILMQSELAQTLINQESIKVTFNTDIEINGLDKTKVESGINILNNVSRFAQGFAINKGAVSAGAKGLKAVSGSDAHKVIYNVGKFFGHNFKPYEAVKYADKVAKVGSIVGKVAVVLPFLVAGYEEYAESKYAEKIKEERQKVRQSYDEIANEIKISFQKQFDRFVTESYDMELSNTAKIIQGIRNSDKLKEEEVVSIQGLLNEGNSILKELN